MTDHYQDALASDEHALAYRLVAVFDHPLRDERHRAMAQLVEMGENAVAALIDALGHEEGRARQGALRALLQIRSPQAIDALMDYVMNHQDEIGDNRAFAMQALAASTSPHIADHDRLLAFLKRAMTDRDDFVRAYAYVALGRLGDVRTKPLLERALNERDPFAAEKAAEALARLETTAAIRGPVEERRMPLDQIEFGLQATTAPEREMASKALLTRIKDDGFDAYPTLTRLLHGPNFIGKRSALVLLGQLRERRAFTQLVRLAEPGANSHDLQSHALRAIASIAPNLDPKLDAEALGRLTTALPHLVRHKDLFVRANAVAALAALPDEEAIEQLVVACRDDELWIQEEASSALSTLAGPLIVPYASSLAASITKRVKETLGVKRRDGQLPTPIIKQLKVVARLISVLAASVPDRPHDGFAHDASAAAFSALRSQSATIRIKGLELLHELVKAGNKPRGHHRDDVAEVVAALTSSQREVLVMVLEVLEAILPHGDAVATASLVNLLYRGDTGLALSAIPLLARAGDIESREVLERLSKDDNRRVADAATDALARLERA